MACQLEVDSFPHLLILAASIYKLQSFQSWMSSVILLLLGPLLEPYLSLKKEKSKQIFFLKFYLYLPINQLIEQDHKYQV